MQVIQRKSGQDTRNVNYSLMELNTILSGFLLRKSLQSPGLGSNLLRNCSDFSGSKPKRSWKSFQGKSSAPFQQAASTHPARVPEASLLQHCESCSSGNFAGMQHHDGIAQAVGKHRGQHCKAAEHYYVVESIQLLKQPSLIYVLACKFNYRIEN